MSEKTGTPRQADEDLVLLRVAAVAKILDFTAQGFSNWLSGDSDGAKAFKLVPFITRGRAKLWRKSDVRRYVESQLTAKV